INFPVAELGISNPSMSAVVLVQRILLKQSLTVRSLPASNLGLENLPYLLLTSFVDVWIYLPAIHSKFSELTAFHQGKSPNATSCILGSDFKISTSTFGSLLNPERIVFGS